MKPYRRAVLVCFLAVLPAALGALPASSVFLAMAAKGLPVDIDDRIKA